MSDYKALKVTSRDPAMEFFSLKNLASLEVLKTVGVSRLKMNFLTIQFFVSLGVECKSRQEPHSKFADHQMHGDISLRHLLDFFPKNEPLL